MQNHKKRLKQRRQLFEINSNILVKINIDLHVIDIYAGTEHMCIQFLLYI